MASSINFFATWMVPLFLLLSLLLPTKIAGRIGGTGSVGQKKLEFEGDEISSRINRILGGGYGHRPQPTTPGKHGGHQYIPKHNGHYDYAYIKRPVDPSEYYHNYKPASKPTSHHSEDDHKPTRHPTKKPTPFPKEPATKPPTNFIIPISDQLWTPPPTISNILWTSPPTSPPTLDDSSAPTEEPTQPAQPESKETEPPVLPPTFEPEIDVESIVDNLIENVSQDPDNGADNDIPSDPTVIQARIAEFALKGGAEFDDPNSYQSAALRRVQEQADVQNFSDIKLMQYYSLYCIYESTNSRTNDFLVQSRIFGEDIPAWTITSGWLENNLDPCEGEWYGVYCEDDQVVQLDLFDNGLTGNFAPEVLYLSGNGFYSTGAGNLFSLDIFGNEYMSNNGDMSWIQDMGSSLGYLYLQDTLFSGKLPPRFPEGLVELDIANTMITGDLDGAAFENLSSLRFLLMDGLQLNSTIPSEIAQLPSLEYLFATDAMITGDLSYMESMPAIFEHWVDRNPGLGGTIPPSLGSLTTLQSFSIAECGFTGTIPESLGNLGLMQQMWLYGNQLSGEIPGSLGNLSFMRIFEVENNNLSDSMPQSICDNFANGMLRVLGADCDKLDCPCCTCCTVDECMLQN